MFIYFYKRPLGELDYLRIWHDNSGKDPSWFLKLVIVQDLPTREKFYFICNKWLAYDKDEGVIDRVLPVACKKQMTDLKYLLKERTKERFSENHKWFSILSKPVLSNFTRLDRAACCFVVLFMAMLMDILYYERDSESTANTVSLGPFTLSLTQVINF